VTYFVGNKKNIHLFNVINVPLQRYKFLRGDTNKNATDLPKLVKYNINKQN
jgi:hypothetical protein